MIDANPKKDRHKRFAGICGMLISKKSLSLEKMGQAVTLQGLGYE